MLMRSRRIATAAAWTVVLLLLAASPRIATAARSGVTSDAAALTNALTRAASASGYRFTANVAQQSNAKPGARVYFEGTAHPEAGELQFTARATGGSVLDRRGAVEFRVVNDVAEARVGDGPWQPVDDISDIAAPGGDLLGYASFATNIRYLDPAAPSSAAIPVSGAAPAPDGVARFAFDLDSGKLAGHLGDLMRKRMIERERMPVSMPVDTKKAFEGVSGSGELWVGPDGLPLRQLVWVQFPVQDDGTQSQASIQVDFAEFEAPVQSSAGEAAAHVVGMLSAPGLGLALMAVMGVLVTQHSRSQRLYAALAMAVIFSVVGGPLIQAHSVLAFTTHQKDKAAAQKADQDKAEQRQSLLGGVKPRMANPHADRLAEIDRLKVDSSDVISTVTAAQAYLFQVCDTDPNGDADNDGLTNLQECLIGTLPSQADTDSDGLDDGVEVKGGQLTHGTTVTNWYLDPLLQDSNLDGLPDGLEWHADANGSPTDTDGDGTPDAWDDDNDGDGVTDNLDMSPYYKGTTTYSGDNPLALTLDDLDPGKLVKVEFQVRPTNAKHLWYAMNVLDWPQGDKQGQIQDADGKTFYDLDPSLPEVPNAYGDVRLVPMIEIEITGSTANLPTDDTLGAFGITTQTVAAGKTMVYVPLTLVSDSTGNKNEAFYGHMFYRAADTWGDVDQVRLVWTVQALVDTCSDYSNNACDEYSSYNNLQVVQTYYDSYTLTGMHVEEAHGTDMAVAYEDPTVATDSPLYINDVLGLLYGLDQRFLSGADCDSQDASGACVGNGTRDITVDDIYDRFNHTTNAGVSSDERWNIPNELTVVKNSYESMDLAMLDTTVTTTQEALTTSFTAAWTASQPITPTLLYAWGSSYRQVNLDATAVGSANISASGYALTVDLASTGTSAVPVERTVGLKWMPYAYDGTTGKWSHYDTDAYWDVLASDANTYFATQTVDDQEEYTAELQVLYVSMTTGLSNLVQVDGTALPANYETYDKPVAFSLFGGAGSIVLKVVKLYFNTSVRMIQVTEALGDGFAARTQAIIKYFAKRYQSLVRVAGEGGVKVMLGIVIAFVVIMGVTYLLSQVVHNGTAQVALHVAAGVSASILALGFNLLYPAYQVYSAVQKGSTYVEVLTGSSEAIGFISKIAIIGFVLSAGLAIGVFIWAMSQHKVSTQIQVNELGAVMIAQIIVAFVLVILALTGIGYILVGLLAALDLVLLAFGAKWSVSGAVVQALADVIYKFKLTIKDPDTSSGTAALDLVDEADGYVDGNSVRFMMPVTTTLQQAIPTGEDGLKENSMVYEMANFDQTQAGTSTSKNARKNDWDVTQYDTYQETGPDGESYSEPLYQGTVVDYPALQIPLAAGINWNPQFYLDFAYALTGEEDWVGGIYSDEKIVSGSDNNDMGAAITMDVLPATIDGFVDVTSWSGLNGGLSIADSDGDGALPYARGGLDPDDSTWDTDGDGLSDGYELGLRSLSDANGFVDLDAARADTDGDGVSDRTELTWATNPGNPDTDGDGLTDGEELRPAGGWLLNYGGSDGTWTRVWSDPLESDVDVDGMTDLFERTQDTCPDCAPWADPTNPQLFNPNVPNLSPVPLYVDDSSAGGFVAPSSSVVLSTTTANDLTADMSLAGTLNVQVPKLYTGAPLTAQVALQSGYSQTLVSTLHSSTTGGPAVVTSTMDLNELSDFVWSWDAAVDTSNATTFGVPVNSAVAATHAWSEPYVVATVEETHTGRELVVYSVSATGAVQDSHSLGATDSAPPDLTCADNGACIVVWPLSDLSAQSTSDWYGRVKMARLQNGLSSPSVGTLWTGTAGQFAARPRIATDGTDFMAAWRMLHGNYGSNVMARPVYNAGTFKEDAATVATAKGQLDDSWLSIDWTDAAVGTYFATWWDNGYLTRGTIDKSGAGSGIVHSQDSPLDLAMAYDPLSEQALAAFVYPTGTHDTPAWAVGARRLTAAGSSGLIQLGTLGWTLPEWPPTTVAVEANPANGGWLVAWAADDGSTTYQAVGPDGSLEGATQSFPGDSGIPLVGLSCALPEPELSLEFNEDAGASTFYDSSAYGNNATCTPGTNCPNAGVEGRFGTGALFPSAGRLGADVSQSTADFTTEAWFKTSCNTCALLHRQNTHKSITLANGNVCGMARKTVSGSTSADQICSSGTNLADGLWHQVIHVGDGNKHMLYVDGHLRAQSGTISFATCSSCTGFTIGEGYEGYLDQVRYYDRPLSALEINDSYKAATAIYDLDEAPSATEASDSSQNGYDATCTNCPTFDVAGVAYTGAQFDGKNDMLKVDAVNRAVATYAYDFEGSAGTEWSDTSVSSATRTGVAAQTTGYLGSFGNKTVKLNLTNLPTHTALNVSFDLYVLGSWDGVRTDEGPDSWRWGWGTQDVISTTFSNGDDSLGNYQYWPDYEGWHTGLYWGPSTEGGVFPGVILARDRNGSLCSGTKQTLYHSAPDLGSQPIGNDTVSCVELPDENSFAALYKDINYGGTAWYEDPKRGRLDSYDNDAISSVKVWPAAHSPKQGALSDSITAGLLPGSVYHMSTELTTARGDGIAASAVSLYFQGINLASDEKWGLDNVVVTAEDNGSSLPLTNSSFTVSAWAKAAGTPKNQWILGQASGYNLDWSYRRLSVGFNAQGNFSCDLYGHYANKTAPTDGDWHHYACTFDASTKTLTPYVDGVAGGSTTMALNYLGTGATSIGAQPAIVNSQASGYAGYFAGTLDEVAVWTEALSADEIAALFRKKKVIDQDVTVCVMPRQEAGGNNLHISRLVLRETATNLGSDSQSITTTLDVDTDAPAAVIQSPTSDGYVGGAEIVAVKGIASDATSYVQGVEVSIDGGSWQAASGTGSWSFPWDLSGVSDGSHTIRARATDAVGHIGAPTSVSVKVDRTPPTVSVRAKPNGVGAQRDPTGRWLAPLVGDVSDTGSGLDNVQVLLQGGANLAGNGWQRAFVNGSAWSMLYVLPPLGNGGDSLADPSGVYTVTVRALDKVGNRTPDDAEPTEALAVDAAGPVITLANPTAGEVVSTTIALAGSATDLTGAQTVEVGIVPGAEISALDDAVGHFPFNELYPTDYLVDQSGSNMVAHCTSCPIAGQPGESDLAVELDGSSNTYSLPTLDLAGKSFTVSAWAKRAGSGRWDIIASEGTQTQDKGFHFGFRSTDKFTCAFWQDGLTTSATYTDGDWHHWSCTFDATTRKRTIYRDGVAVASDTAAAVFSGSVGGYLGSRFGTDSYFGGLIDEFTVHDRALADWEVADLYAYGQEKWHAATTAGGTDAAWTFDLSELQDPPEGEVQLNVRGTDVQGNRTRLGGQRVWRGILDVSAPVITATVKVFTMTTSQGTSTTMTFRCRATDFSLNTNAACDQAPNSPTGTPKFQNSQIEITNLNDLVPWYAETFTATVRPHRLDGARAYGATRTDGILEACDNYGHCATTGITQLPSGSLSIAQEEPLGVAVAQPSTGTVLTSTATVPISGTVHAAQGLAALSVAVNGTQVYSTTWPDSATDEPWGFDWTPPGEGTFHIVPTVRDTTGAEATAEAPTDVYVDMSPPSLVIAPTVLTTTHLLQTGVLGVRGTVADSVAVHVVDVTAGREPEERAQVTGDAWTSSYVLRSHLDGAQLPVTARAVDLADHETSASASVTVDVVPPRPGAIRLAYVNGAGATVPVEAGDTVTDAVSLALSWDEATDGSGIAAYEADWTNSDDASSAVFSRFVGPATLTQPVGDAQVWYAHLRLLDGVGNARVVTYGPVYVDGPRTPDLVQDIGYDAWASPTCSLVDIDRRWDHQNPDSRRERTQQAYVSWDAAGLRFAWVGADWNTDGDMFLYVDSAPGGSEKLLDPYSAGTGRTILLPGNRTPVTGALASDAVSLDRDTRGAALEASTAEEPAMQADEAVWVEDASTAWLYEAVGDTWQRTRELTATEFELRHSPTVSRTDILLSFEELGITDPATSAVSVLAVASEDGALDLWSTMPARNPVSSERVSSSAPGASGVMGSLKSLFLPIVVGHFRGAARAAAEAPEQTAVPRRGDFALSQSFHWASLADGACPNGRLGGPGPTGAGPFVDSDLTFDLHAEPVGTTYSFQDDGLYWWWTEMFGASDLPIIPSRLFDHIDTNHPPLAPTGALSYTLTYANRGTEAATGVKVALESWFSLDRTGATNAHEGYAQRQVVDIGQVAPGATGQLELHGHVDVEGVGRARYNLCRQDHTEAACVDQLAWAALDAYVYDDRSPLESGTDGQLTSPPIDWLSADHEVDASGPSYVEVTSPLSVVREGPIDVTGIAYDASDLGTVEVQVETEDDSLTGTCALPMPAHGRWECQVDPGPQPDGASLDIRARVTDEYGQESEWSAPVSVVVDLTPPTAMVADVLQGTVLGAGVHPLHGRATDNASIAAVNVCRSDLDCTKVPIKPDEGSIPVTAGSWSYGVQESIEADPTADGVTRTLSLYALDEAGNPSTAPVTISYIADVIRPDLKITDVHHLTDALDPTAVLSGTVTDGTKVEMRMQIVRRDGRQIFAAPTRVGNTWGFAPAWQRPGTYRVWVRATDEGRNQCVIGPFAIEVKAPAFSIFMPSAERR